MSGIGSESIDTGILDQFMQAIYYSGHRFIYPFFLCILIVSFLFILIVSCLFFLTYILHTEYGPLSVVLIAPTESESRLFTFTCTITYSCYHCRSIVYIRFVYL
jgi:hypothetical protein